MGTAWADYTSSPSPTSIVRGSGGGTAFTGGELSAAVVVGLLLAALGALALFMGRWVAERPRRED